MLKIYKTQAEVEADIKDNVLTVKGNVKFECSILILASLNVNGDITARGINAWDINAWDINARDINAWDINARDINARGINAWDINAWDINARDINARDINARDILYYAFCCVYYSIKCLSIKAKREKHQEPICLEEKLEIIPKEDDEVVRAIKLLETRGKLKDGKILI